MFFNLYLEEIINKDLVSIPLVNNKRVIDDKILLVETIYDLKSLVRATDISEKYRRSLYLKPENWRYRNMQLFEAIIMNENNDVEMGMGIRIGKGTIGFIKMEILSCSKVKTMKCYVLSMIYYAIELWIMNKAAWRNFIIWP